MPDTLTLAPPYADSPAPGGCHHCGAPLTCCSQAVTISGREARVCGDACRTAVETIAGAGGGAWYGLRTHTDAHGAVLDSRHRAELEAWRVPEVEAAAVRRAGGGARAVTLTVEGMRCAGCAWLVERLLTSISGVRGAEVDFALGRAEVRFDADGARLPVLLETLAGAGYRAAPYTVGAEEAAIESERRARLRSIGIASVFAMQVMLLSAALYAGGHYGMEPRFEALFRWLAMVLTVPVLAWPGRAFFTGAFAALRARRLTMDVPVALGLSIAFLGSVRATITGEGAVWFDSVVMFVTLLCIARYLELLARRRATATVRALARSAPLVATRIRSGETAPAGGAIHAGDAAPDESFRARSDAAGRIPAAALRPGDRVRVRPGETAPAGSVVHAGDAALDESFRARGDVAGRIPAATLRPGETAPADDAIHAGDDALDESFRARGDAAGRIPAAALRPGDRVRVRPGETVPADDAIHAEDDTLDESFRARSDAAGRIPAAALCPGDRVRVRPGETVPADGVIRSGESALDESLLTGESAPVARSAGETVLAGSVNGHGVIEVEVTRAGDATVLGGLLRRAERAARERPEIARLADRAAAWFIAGVLVLAAGVAFWWLLHDPARMVPVLVSVLVVTCPCALSLATPAAMTAAFGALARTGLIATRADTIERLALVTHCLADKTGTLTEGRFRLRSVSALADDARETECLRLAAALERHATHPVGAAIVAGAGGSWAEAERSKAQSGIARESEVRLEAEGDVARAGGGRSEAGGIARTREVRPEAEDDTARTEVGEYQVQDVIARIGGVAGRIGGVRHAIGSADFVARICAPAPDAPHEEAGEGDTHVFLAREGVLLARFTLADTPRAGAKDLIEGLRACGIETTIASGDRAGAVDHVARALGIARRLAGLSPEDKLHEANRLAARGERVLMFGDGVNDTPALAGAHVSVAMGHGAAAAAARAGAVFIGDDPRGLLAGLGVARQARRIVRQNLAWAAGYNLVALPLAASGAVPPWAAAIGMSLSSLAVVGNALRLGRPARACGIER